MGSPVHPPGVRPCPPGVRPCTPARFHPPWEASKWLRLNAGAPPATMRFIAASRRPRNASSGSSRGAAAFVGSRPRTWCNWSGIEPRRSGGRSAPASGPSEDTLHDEQALWRVRSGAHKQSRCRFSYYGRQRSVKSKPKYLLARQEISK